MSARSASATGSFQTVVPWRDFLRLAVEGLTIGLFVSAVLGLAVLVIASQAPAHERMRPAAADHAASDGGGSWNAAGVQAPGRRIRSA